MKQKQEAEAKLSFVKDVFVFLEHTQTVIEKTILLNKNSELVTGVQDSFTKVDRFPIYFQ